MQETYGRSAWELGASRTVAFITRGRAFSSAQFKLMFRDKFDEESREQSYQNVSRETLWYDWGEKTVQGLIPLAGFARVGLFGNLVFCAGNMRVLKRHRRAA
jgi:hypothetical protein